MLIEFCQENALVIANTLFQQHRKSLYTWTSPDGQHQNQIDYILCSQRWRSCIQSAKTRLGADCGSDHELLIAEFILKLKKVGKPTRPFRYDLNQIPYDYTVEMRNRFKGLDLIDYLRNYGWRFMTLFRRQGARLSPRKRNEKKEKKKKQNGCEEALQIAVKSCCMVEYNYWRQTYWSSSGSHIICVTLNNLLNFIYLIRLLQKLNEFQQK